MKQTCEKFAAALYEFLSAINSQDVKVAALAECVEATEEKEAPAAPAKKEKKGDKFPKKFAQWAEGRDDVFGRLVVTEWNKNKIQFLHTVEQTVDVEELIGDVVEELRNLSGNKEIEVLTKVIETKAPVTAAKKAVEAPKPAAQVVTADQVKAACVALSSKLKSKEKVRAILEEIGGTVKVDEIDPSKYAQIWNTMKQAMEASPLASTDESGW